MAIRSRMASRNAADLRCLAHQRDIEVGDGATPARDKGYRVPKEDFRRRTLPRRIDRRKMRADVAVADRAEDGVGQRMQADIGVGMASERLGDEEF